VSITFVDHMSSVVSLLELEEVDVQLLLSDQVKCECVMWCVCGMCECMHACMYSVYGVCTHACM